MNLWCYIYTSYMFSKFFYIEISDVPSIKHQWFIDGTSITHQWRTTDGGIATFTCSIAESKTTNCEFLRFTHFQSNWAKTIVKGLSWKAKKRKFELWAKKNLVGFLKNKDLLCFLNAVRLTSAVGKLFRR